MELQGKPGPDMVAKFCGFGANVSPFASLVLWLVSVHPGSLLDRGKGGFVVVTDLTRRRVSWPLSSFHTCRQTIQHGLCIYVRYSGVRK